MTTDCTSIIITSINQSIQTSHDWPFIILAISFLQFIYFTRFFNK